MKILAISGSLRAASHNTANDAASIAANPELAEPLRAAIGRLASATRDR